MVYSSVNRFRFIQSVAQDFIPMSRETQGQSVEALLAATVERACPSIDACLSFDRGQPLSNGK